MSAQLQTPGWFCSWGVCWIRGWVGSRAIDVAASRNICQKLQCQKVIHSRYFTDRVILSYSHHYRKYAWPYTFNVAKCEHTTLNCASAQILHYQQDSLLFLPSSLPHFPIACWPLNERWRCWILNWILLGLGSLHTGLGLAGKSDVINFSTFC